MTNHQRTRTYSWTDPQEVMRQMSQYQGAEAIAAMRDGLIPPPPMLQTLNIYPEEIGEGRVVFAGTPEEYHYNPIGVVHGAYAMALLDTVLAVAIQTKLPSGFSASTIDIHLTYLRPLTLKTGKVRAIGEVVHLGRQIATAEAKLLDSEDKLYCTAASTFMVVNFAEKPEAEAKRVSRF